MDLPQRAPRTCLHLPRRPRLIAPEHASADDATPSYHPLVAAVVVRPKKASRFHAQMSSTVKDGYVGLRIHAHRHPEIRQSERFQYTLHHTPPLRTPWTHSKRGPLWAYTLLVLALLVQIDVRLG
ncbi:hypothetical protein C8Q78DRAFT_631610 [Trametes maxima]|nr:hypothetical protein C8Q78DRAFT_631610 [Trametes maxima]